MREADLQVLVADYIRFNYPNALFHSDFGSGIKLTMGQAIKQKRQNGGRRAWPDMFIAEPKKKQGKTYHGLFIELKKEDTKIYKKDGTLVANEHIREQYDTMQQLRQAGYYADFACGRNAAKSLIDWYLA